LKAPETDLLNRLLAELSEKAAKPWADIFTEALSTYRSKVNARGKDDESFSAAAARFGLVGCVEGPSDLSTNPGYMDDFGEQEN
jgi:hypothetical protein